MDIDASHVLLGMPLQYDNHTTHEGRENTYSFSRNNKKIVLMPQDEKIEKSQNESKALVMLPKSEKELQREIKASTTVLVLTTKEQFSTDNKSSFSPTLLKLLQEFKYISPKELPEGLSPPRNI